jgi:hypothetical protein
MHDHTSNTLAGAGIALASLGGLFAQAPPGSIGVAGSVIVLATLLVRAAQELGGRWITYQAAKLQNDELHHRIAALELDAANQRKLALAGYCPLGEGGQPACLKTPPSVSPAGSVVR